MQSTDRKGKVERNRRKRKERDKTQDKENFREKMVDNTLGNKTFGRE